MVKFQTKNGNDNITLQIMWGSLLADRMAAGITIDVESGEAKPTDVEEYEKYQSGMLDRAIETEEDLFNWIKESAGELKESLTTEVDINDISNRNHSDDWWGHTVSITFGGEDEVIPLETIHRTVDFYREMMPDRMEYENYVVKGGWYERPSWDFDGDENVEIKEGVSAEMKPGDAREITFIFSVSNPSMDVGDLADEIGDKMADEIGLQLWISEPLDIGKSTYRFMYSLKSDGRFQTRLDENEINVMRNVVADRISDEVAEEDNVGFNSGAEILGPDT